MVGQEQLKVDESCALFVADGENAKSMVTSNTLVRGNHPNWEYYIIDEFISRINNHFTVALCFKFQVVALFYIHTKYEKYEVRDTYPTKKMGRQRQGQTEKKTNNNNIFFFSLSLSFSLFLSSV
jgi:hypothetical protein